jgi:hypothetical protein
MTSHPGTLFKKIAPTSKEVLYYRGQLRSGSYPPDCAVECAVDPAYRLQKEQKGGKPTSAFPQLIHGYGARSNIFHNHFLGNLRYISANSTAMTSRTTVLISPLMTSSFPEMFSIRAILISYRIILQKIQSIFKALRGNCSEVGLSPDTPPGCLLLSKA